MSDSPSPAAGWREEATSRPSECEYCGGTGLCGYEQHPQFCGMCDAGGVALLAWQKTRAKANTWFVSTNTDTILLGGFIATTGDARKAIQAIEAMISSLPAYAVLEADALAAPPETAP